MKIIKRSFDFDRLKREFQGEFGCRHVQLVPSRKEKSNKQPYYRRQCTACGYSPSRHLSFEEILEFERGGGKVRDWSRQLYDCYLSRARKIAEPIRRRINRERTEDWWRQYDAYLLTKEWAHLRQRVLTRDKFQCQMCFEKASQVHHQTYMRVGEELLEDLISLCAKCHKQAHEKERETESVDGGKFATIFCNPFKINDK